MNTQQDFLDEFRKWSNIDLTWIAWSWKTYIIKQAIVEAENQWKNVIIAAPTGIAAINAWGSTIHSIFKLFWNNYHTNPTTMVNFDDVDIIVFDEDSMINTLLFDYCDKVVRKNCSVKDKPFGWKQIICVWDKAQLPPIFNMWDSIQRQQYNKLMEDKWWVTFDLSNAYKEWNFVKINLTEPQRSKDPKLNDLLNRIREWDIKAVKEFKTDGYTSQFFNKATHIFATNNEVDWFNYERLLKIPWKQTIFKWVIRGDFNMNNVLVPEELKLKVWARIMVCKNLPNGLVNGDTWEILKIDLSNLEITIMSDRLEEEKVIWLEKWENIVYDEHWNKEIKWTLRHFPMKLWWAITAHKSQGLTLDKVMFHYKPHLTQELVYVACSRAKEYENIYIIK